MQYSSEASYFCLLVIRKIIFYNTFLSKWGANVQRVPQEKIFALSKMALGEKRAPVAVLIKALM